MIENFFNFFDMKGYGFYILSAYGIVLLFLFLQWFIAWRRWKKYKLSRNHGFHD